MIHMLSLSIQPCIVCLSLSPCLCLFVLSSIVLINPCFSSPPQGIDPIHQTRVVEILKDGEGDRRRSRDSLSSVKYESGSETGEEVSMGVEWNGVSTNPLQCLPSPLLLLPHLHLHIRPVA